MQKRLITLCIFLTGSFFASAESAVHPWEAMELTYTSSKTLENPYVESLQEGKAPYLSAVLERQGSDEKITVPGFWDGGTNWTVRFDLPTPGLWDYKIVSDDPSIAGNSGTIECIAWTKDDLKQNPTRRGLVQVCQTPPHPGRYFEYADGTPFLWIGDTWWNWTQRGIHFESFQKLADDRAAKGFTVGQLFFAGRGWNRNASLLNRDFTQPDLDQIRHVERYIRYANEKGITVWIHGWWGSNDIVHTIGAEAMRRWWRYVVHRLHAYNVIWVLAGEYNLNNYGGFDLSFWNDLGRLVKKEDPYDRITSVHPTPPGWSGGAEAPQWSTAEVLHDQDWLDYNQSQVGHGRWRNEMIPLVVSEAYHAEPPKPIVVTEPWYEFIQGNPTATDIRFGAWSAILSGAAGHSYAGGHVWKAHVPELPHGVDSWPMEMSFEVNTLDYPGAKSIAFLAKFLRQSKWWNTVPHPEFVINNPSTFCRANPGQEYIVYLRYGGVVSIDLRDASSDSKFLCQWADLTENTVRKEFETTGGRIAEFHPPEMYPGSKEDKDWVLYMKKK